MTARLARAVRGVTLAALVAGCGLGPSPSIVPLSPSAPAPTGGPTASLAASAPVTPGPGSRPEAGLLVLSVTTAGAQLSRIASDRGAVAVAVPANASWLGVSADGMVALALTGGGLTVARLPSPAGPPAWTPLSGVREEVTFPVWARDASTVIAFPTAQIGSGTALTTAAVPVADGVVTRTVVPGWELDGPAAVLGDGRLAVTAIRHDGSRRVALLSPDRATATTGPAGALALAASLDATTIAVATGDGIRVGPASGDLGGPWADVPVATDAADNQVGALALDGSGDRLAYVLLDASQDPVSIRICVRATGWREVGRVPVVPSARGVVLGWLP